MKIDKDAEEAIRKLLQYAINEIDNAIISSEKALKEPLAVKLDMVNTAKDVFGEAAAKELWITLGLSAFDNENNPTTEESPSKK